MHYEGMVHALEEIHRLLKPTGRLIDIHPVAVSPRVEINEAGKIHLAGYLSVHQWFTDFLQADNALEEIIRRGLFSIEQEEIFDVPIHYASVEEMQTELMKELDYFARDAQSASEDAPYIEVLVKRAEKLMRSVDSTAQLIAREPTHISRLKPT